MKRILGEVWKEKEGSKAIWKVQFNNGIMNFNTKRDAVRASQTFYARLALNNIT